MGLGSTAKTLQRVADMADDVYSRMNDMRSRLENLDATLSRTDERLERLETEVHEQRAVIDALAEAQGIDVERAVAEAHIDEAERDGEGSEEGEPTV